MTVLSPIEIMCDTQTVSIGGRVIGPGHPAYIIAEAGVNHNGDERLAMRLVEVAREAGADAVKFQAFRAENLVTADAPAANYQKEAQSVTTQRELLEPLELADEQFARVKQRCDEIGIEFLATPFGPQEARMLAELGARAIKIASTDINNPPLLAAAAQADVPMIVSTGAATAREMDAGVDLLREFGVDQRMILMHCVSSYPTRPEDANLRAIREMAERYACPVGFSDHTEATTTGSTAVAAGATVLEKHFTLDRTMEGPDQSFSLEPDGLRAYIRQVRETERVLGTGRLGVLPVEQEVRNVSRSSLVAAQPIRAGQLIHPEMLTVKRPGGGIEPIHIRRIQGRVAGRDIPADTVLTWDALA